MQIKNEPQENILGTERISRLLIRFGVPGIISLVVNSIYNIVDQIFIGQGVGYLGNGATNVIYPLTVLNIAFAALMGDGAASYMSLMLGTGKKQDAARGAAAGLLGTAACGVVLMIVYLLFLEPLCWLLGGTESNLPYALEYGRVIAFGIPCGAVCVGWSSIIRADGSPNLCMGGLLLGCAINLILDPIFILVLGWGMAGAAWATILGMIGNSVVCLIYVLRGMKSVHLERGMLRESLRAMPRIMRLGVASMLFQLALVVAMAIQNSMLVRIGASSRYGADIPLSAMGVTMKVFMIVIAILNGLSAGAQPIYGYNYGAGKYDRVKETYKKVFFISTAILCLAFAVFQLWPMAIVRIFGAEDELYNEFAVKCLQVFLFGLPISALQTISGVFFQSVGRPMLSTAVSLSRQIIFMIPLLFLLSALFGIDGMLYMGPTADVCALILTAVLLRVSWPKIFDVKNTARF